MRCIDCNGDSAVDDIIAGLEWVAANAQRPAVASLSLGTSSVNDALDAALLALIDLGVTAVVAAGNFGSGGLLLQLVVPCFPQCLLAPLMLSTWWSCRAVSVPWYAGSTAARPLVLRRNASPCRRVRPQPGAPAAVHRCCGVRLV